MLRIIRGNVMQTEIGNQNFSGHSKKKNIRTIFELLAARNNDPYFRVTL